MDMGSGEEIDDSRLSILDWEDGEGPFRDIKNQQSEFINRQ